MSPSTLPCTTCGHPVAPTARRCPSCNQKRPAPTMANALAALAGLVVVVVVVIAIVASHGGGNGGSGAVGHVRSQYGSCLSSAGVSLDGADVQSSAVSGWHAVFLSDGAEFGVEDSSGKVEAGNARGFADLTAGGC